MSSLRRSPRLACQAPAPPVPASAVPAPSAPYRCDDFDHCRANRSVLKGQNCDPNRPFTCPGLAPDPTPDSYSGLVHPIPDTVHVCRRCVTHDNQISFRTIISNPDLTAQCRGFRGQLCNSCIRDEVELYWRRVREPRPQGPTSITLTERWPTTARGGQDLCICTRKAIIPFQNYCHACRAQAFINNAQGDRNLADVVLRTRQKPVIKGLKKDLINGGTRQYKVRPSQITRRRLQPHRIVRMCPCGERPKAPAATRAQEYITICTACMGVKIRPGNFPTQPGQTVSYLDESHFGRRYSARSGGVAKTKGPKRANRSHLYRVNIERGWVDDDPFVGGTY